MHPCCPCLLYCRTVEAICPHLDNMKPYSRLNTHLIGTSSLQTSMDSIIWTGIKMTDRIILKFSVKRSCKVCGLRLQLWQHDCQWLTLRSLALKVLQVVLVWWSSRISAHNVWEPNLLLSSNTLKDTFWSWGWRAVWRTLWLHHLWVPRDARRR